MTITKRYDYGPANSLKFMMSKMLGAKRVQLSQKLLYENVEMNCVL